MTNRTSDLKTGSERSPNEAFKGAMPLFGLAGLGWLGIGMVLCRFLSSDLDETSSSTFWMLGLWFLSLIDLGIMAKLISIVPRILRSDPEKDGQNLARGIQALTWGLLKIVCLGLFVFILLKGQKIPMHGLLLGMGTLAVVPLTGGIVWSQRMLRHA